VGDAIGELRDDDPRALEARAALQAGDLDALALLLEAHPGIARARIVSTGRRRGSRTLLHVFADWPGHNPRPREVVELLVAHGADLDAPVEGTSTETALHCAASSDDVDLIDALLDGGADIEARGAVIGGGTAIADATAFGQWRAAARLRERGAHANLFESAVLGLDDRVLALLGESPAPDSIEITHALWGACHGGRRSTAELLLARGAEIDWVGWDGLTPLDVARRTAGELGRPDAAPLVPWLLERGARSATDPA
jgi:hypothetical protein